MDNLNGKLLDALLWQPEARTEALIALHALTHLKLLTLHEHEMDLITHALRGWVDCHVVEALAILSDQRYIALPSAIVCALGRSPELDARIRSSLPRWALEVRVRDRLLLALQTPLLTVDSALAATG